MRCFFQIVTISLCLGIALPAWANKKPDPAVTQKLCDQIIKQVYADIQSQKSKFSDLKLYNLIALKENEWGYKYIKYRYLDMKGSRKVDELAFRIEFIPINAEQEYEFDGTHFEYLFPVLNIKMIFYQNDSLKRDQIEVIPYVKRHTRKLMDYQSQYLPIRLRLYPEQETYQVGEDVVLVAELDNISGSNIKLKDVSSKSLAMTDDLDRWGFDLVSRPRKAGTEVLRPNGNLKRKFRLGSFDRPQNKTIHAIYLMEFRGAEPTVTTNFQIVE